MLEEEEEEEEEACWALKQMEFSRTHRRSAAGSRPIKQDDNNNNEIPHFAPSAPMFVCLLDMLHKNHSGPIPAGRWTRTAKIAYKQINLEGAIISWPERMRYNSDTFDYDDNYYFEACDS